MQERSDTPKMRGMPSPVYEPTRRGNHQDVTGTVRIADPIEVHAAVRDVLRPRFPDCDLEALQLAFETFGRLYAGQLPGYFGCDTWYHDAQHSLDCALAMARLLDGHDRSVAPPERLGARRAVLGVIIALFHDAGYIRKTGDSARNGAEYTLCHVQRSGDFLRAFLPGIGYAAEAELAARVVHFTGYEIALDRIQVADPKDRLLGFLLGTADVLAQTSDRRYLEKCRAFLYREFTYCGLAGAARPGGRPPVYASAEDLLRKTPEFNRALWEERLDGYFGGVHRYLRAHFDGPDPYAAWIAANLARIRDSIARDALDELRVKPRAISAATLRKILSRPPLSATARAA
jgi:hypothetical protein